MRIKKEIIIASLVAGVFSIIGSTGSLAYFTCLDSTSNSFKIAIDRTSATSTNTGNNLTNVAQKEESVAPLETKEENVVVAGKDSNDLEQDVINEVEEGEIQQEEENLEQEEVKDEVTENSNTILNNNTLVNENSSLTVTNLLENLETIDN